MISGLVSILIPTHNRADLVVEAIHNAKSQTYPSKQIIVIDDGSSDDTRRRVAGIDGVEYIHQRHQGQGAARNCGLRHATGEYIASHDSDDLWDSDFLSQSVSCLEEFHLDLVFTNWHKLRGTQLLLSDWEKSGDWKRYRTNPQGDWFMLTPRQVRRLFLATCPAPASALVVRRSSIASGWGEHMLIADDWYLLLDMVMHRPCKAAFSMARRWIKRVDGRNIYDGRPRREYYRRLYLHDQRVYTADFAHYLTPVEKLRLAARQTKYRALMSVIAARDAVIRLAGRQCEISETEQGRSEHTVD